MAYIKRVKIVYTKGILEGVDPFMLFKVVKPALARREQQEFETAYLSIGTYADLLALCNKYVELDDAKEVGTEPQFGAHRDVYDDTPVPWRKLLWDTAVLLLGRPSVTKGWQVRIGGESDYHGPSLWLESLTQRFTASPSVDLDDARFGKTVKIRTRPGLALNTPLEKATAEKIATKLLEHGEKILTQQRVRAERETDQNSKKRKAAILVEQIAQTYEIPRYYEGSRDLELRTLGANLRVVPEESGSATVTLTMTVHNKAQLESLRGPMEFIKALKQSVDASKKEREHA